MLRSQISADGDSVDVKLVPKRVPIQMAREQYLVGDLIRRIRVKGGGGEA